jgi:predicted amidohydrolase YtcJ
MARIALVNGKIVTVDNLFSIASAVAIDGDRDYLTVPAAEIRDIAPVATMVGGRLVHGALAGLLACHHGNPAE